MKKIKEREDIRWVMHTDSLSPMLAIENNRENHPILNQLYDLLTELKNLGKQIILCKVPAHTGIEEANKAANQAIDIPGITRTRLPYTDYYLTIRKARNSEWQREWINITSKLHYIKPRIEERKVHTVAVGNMRSN